MTILIPDTIGEGSVEREHPFLAKIVLIMNSCFIQCNAPLVKYGNVAEKKNSFWQEWLEFGQIQINLIVLEVQIVSVTLHDNFQLVCIKLAVYTYFSPTIL